MKLLKSHGSQWGPGKVHIQDRELGEFHTWCGKDIYAEIIEGERDDVTCGSCLRKGLGK